MSIFDTVCKEEIDIILDESFKKELRNFAFLHEKNWFYLSDKFWQIYPPEDITSKLLKRINLTPVRTVILINEPYCVIPPHKDTRQKGRKTCLTWSINKNLDTCAPTLYYDILGNVSYKHYYTEKCYIMNTMATHGMINNENYRLLFQLSFEEHYETIKTKLKIGD